MKRCNTCHIDKPLDSFYNDRTNSNDGKRAKCKVCQKAFRRNSKWYRDQHSLEVELKKPLGVYLATFDKGTYVGEGVLYSRERVHKYGRSHVNKGGMKLLDFKVLQYIDNKAIRKQAEKIWIGKLNPSLNALL